MESILYCKLHISQMRDDVSSSSSVATLRRVAPCSSWFCSMHRSVSHSAANVGRCRASMCQQRFINVYILNGITKMSGILLFFFKKKHCDTYLVGAASRTGKSSAVAQVLGNCVRLHSSEWLHRTKRHKLPQYHTEAPHIRFRRKLIENNT